MKKNDIDIKKLFSSLALSKKKSEMIKGGEGGDTGGGGGSWTCGWFDCENQCTASCSNCTFASCRSGCVSECMYTCMVNGCASLGTLLGN